MIAFRSKSVYLFFAALIAVMILVACGGSGTYSPTHGSMYSPPNEVVGITVTPKSAEIIPGGSFLFVATVTGTSNTAVTWQILSGVGSISSTGLFSAPGSQPDVKRSGKPRGDFFQSTIQATSVADPTKSATATVTISQVSLALSPLTPTVQENKTVQFTATVSDFTPNHGVTWSLPDGSVAGTISSTTGLYTAPSHTGSYQIQATSVDEPTSSISTTVKVIAAQNVSISIDPSTVNVPTGGSTQFYPIVTGTTNTAVTWKIIDNIYGASISSSGVFVAPQSIPISPATVTVQATSVADPTKSAIAHALVLYNEG